MGQPINVPFVGAALQRLFGLKGRVSPSLEEFIVPMVVVGDVSQGSAPDVSRACVHQCIQAPVAGQRFRARLEIPGGLLCKVDTIYVRCDTPGFFEVQFVNVSGAQAATAAKAFTDGRLLAEGQLPASVLTFGTQAANLVTEEFGTFISADPVTIIKPKNWIIGSGDPTQFGFLEFGQQSANAQVMFALELTEYAILL